MSDSVTGDCPCLISSAERGHPASDLMDEDCLPRINVLRGVGLAVAPKPVARTLTAVSLDDHLYWRTVVGYERPSLLDLPEMSLATCAQRIVDIVEHLRTHPSDELPAELLVLCHALERQTDWRFNRVACWKGIVAVERITIADIQSDLADGSLENVVLEGVNAVVKPARRKQLDILRDV